MGVMACNRRGCRNIMCGRYSSEYGYICDDCFRELVASNTTHVAAFMDSEETFSVGPGEAWYEKIFPSR